MYHWLSAVRNFWTNTDRYLFFVLISQRCPIQRWVKENRRIKLNDDKIKFENSVTLHIFKLKQFNPLTPANEKFDDFPETSTAYFSWYAELRTFWDISIRSKDMRNFLVFFSSFYWFLLYYSYSVICRPSDQTVGRPRAEIRTRAGRPRGP